MFHFNRCGRIRDMFWDLATQRIGQEDRACVEAHLSQCEACRIELEAVRSTVSLMAGFRAEAVPASRLGWRDLEGRVALHQSARRLWWRTPAAQMAFGGGALAITTALVMIAMQLATDHPGPLPQSSHDNLAAVQRLTAPVDPVLPQDSAVVGVPSMIGVPHVRTGGGPDTRLAFAHPPRAQRTVTSHSTGPSKAPTTIQLARSDENPDGGSPRQTLKPDYVITPVSSGNDEDSNRQYVIATVSSTSTTVADSGEEMHPW